MKAVVVGSGPAGVAVASALLEGGIAVEMVDFGNQIDPAAAQLGARLRSEPPSDQDQARLRPSPVPRSLMAAAKRLLRMVMGKEGCLDLSNKRRFGSDYVVRDTDWAIPIRGPLLARSLAQGGLSNVWGASCYPLTDGDYAAWPIAEADLAPHYEAVAHMLSLGQTDDALAAAYPIYGPVSARIPPNPLTSRVLERWQSHSERLLAQGIAAGRSRLAVRAADHGAGLGCRLCGLCHTGCPYDAIYRADWTLAELKRHPGFRYHGRRWVWTFHEEAERVVVRTLDLDRNEPWTIAGDALFLAAGTASSLRIAADSLRRYGEPIRLEDNDLYLLPFLWEERDPQVPEAVPFTLNELALRLYVDGYPIHVQFYCMSEQIVDQIQGDLVTFPGPLGRRVRRLLGRTLLGFVYLPGKVSARIEATVIPGDPVGSLEVTHRPSKESARIVRRLIRHLRRHHGLLGLRPLGPVLRATPTGPSGGHVAMGLPMRQSPAALESFPDGRLSGTYRVYAVDGSALPSLPAQNSTYTIMANAHRVGTCYARATSRPPAAGHLPESPSSDATGTSKMPFGRGAITPFTFELDHHAHQYEGARVAAAYHHYVLRQAVRQARLRPGMHVLDYGCGRQMLRRALPAGVRYTGFDVVERLSDLADPRGRRYDRIFAIQVLMCLDSEGLENWVEMAAEGTDEVIVMVPARHFLKDAVLDRLLGLYPLRERMVQSTPREVYGHLGRRFRLVARKNLLWMGELSHWQRTRSGGSP